MEKGPLFPCQPNGKAGRKGPWGASAGLDMVWNQEAQVSAQSMSWESGPIDHLFFQDVLVSGGYSDSAPSMVLKNVESKLRSAEAPL